MSLHLVDWYLARKGSTDGGAQASSSTMSTDELVGVLTDAAEESTDEELHAAQQTDLALRHAYALIASQEIATTSKNRREREGGIAPQVDSFGSSFFAQVGQLVTSLSEHHAYLARRAGDTTALREELYCTARRVTDLCGIVMRLYSTLSSYNETQTAAKVANGLTSHVKSASRPDGGNNNAVATQRVVVPHLVRGTLKAAIEAAKAALGQLTNAAPHGPGASLLVGATGTAAAQRRLGQQNGATGSSAAVTFTSPSAEGDANKVDDRGGGRPPVAAAAAAVGVDALEWMRVLVFEAEWLINQGDAAANDVASGGVGRTSKSGGSEPNGSNASEEALRLVALASERYRNQVQRFGDHSGPTIIALNDWGIALMQAGQLADAKATFKDVLFRVEEDGAALLHHPVRWQAMNNLAFTLYKGAERLIPQRARVATSGAPLPAEAQTMLVNAEKVLLPIVVSKAAGTTKKGRGEGEAPPICTDPLIRADAFNNLAAVFTLQRRFHDAVGCCTASLQASAGVLPDSHPDRCLAQRNLRVCRKRQFDHAMGLLGLWVLRFRARKSMAYKRVVKVTALALQPVCRGFQARRLAGKLLSRRNKGVKPAIMNPARLFQRVGRAWEIRRTLGQAFGLRSLRKRRTPGNVSAAAQPVAPQKGAIAQPMTVVVESVRPAAAATTASSNSVVGAGPQASLTQASVVPVKESTTVKPGEGAAPPPPGPVPDAPPVPVVHTAASQPQHASPQPSSPTQPAPALRDDAVTTYEALRAHFRQRLTALYTFYKIPQKIPTIEKNLDKYKGHEKEFVLALVEKYGPEPSNTYREGLLQQTSEASPPVKSRVGGGLPAPGATPTPPPTSGGRPAPRRTPDASRQGSKGGGKGGGSGKEDFREGIGGDAGSDIIGGTDHRRPSNEMEPPPPPFPSKRGGGGGYDDANGGGAMASSSATMIAMVDDGSARAAPPKCFEPPGDLTAPARGGAKGGHDPKTIATATVLLQACGRALSVRDMLARLAMLRQVSAPRVAGRARR